LHLTGAPQQALIDAMRISFLAQVETARRAGACADYALFADATESLLSIDPRTELAVEVGAELRLGQVLRVMRSDLDTTCTKLAPSGRLKVRGRGKKGGETVVLAEEQRVAIASALAGYLPEFETQYDPEQKKTDFCLFIAGRLSGGTERPGPKQKRPITRSKALAGFHDLKRVAGVDPKPGRGWYGLRRVATDVALQYTSA
jgi:hypothetical protein